MQKLVIKAQKASDSDKPVSSWTVDESEVILKDREPRSNKPETIYHFSPSKAASLTDETLPLDDTSDRFAKLSLISPSAPSKDSSSSPDSEESFLKETKNLEWAANDSVFYDPSTDHNRLKHKTADVIDLSDIPVITPTVPTQVEAIYIPASTTAVSVTTITTSGTTTRLGVPLTTVAHLPLSTVTATAPVATGPDTTATLSVSYAEAPVAHTASHGLPFVTSAPADHTVDPESDSESDMADINPPSFSGTALENGEMWMRHFTNFCEFKAHNDAKALSLFKVLMVGSAATWLDSLEEATRNDWDALKAAFLTRYMTADFLKYKSARELFNSKQGERSTDDYCAHMQKLAKQVGADDQMLRFAVLNGLRSDIAHYVTQKQPTDWKQLLEAARVGEMCSATQPQSDSVVTAQLAVMQDQLRQLTTRIDTPTVAQVTEINDNALPRSPSLRRVSFEDNRRPRDYDRRSRYDDRRPRYDDRSMLPSGRFGTYGRENRLSYRRFDSP